MQGQKNAPQQRYQIFLNLLEKVETVDGEKLPKPKPFSPTENRKISKLKKVQFIENFIRDHVDGNGLLPYFHGIWTKQYHNNKIDKFDFKLKEEHFVGHFDPTMVLPSIITQIETASIEKLGEWVDRKNQQSLKAIFESLAVHHYVIIPFVAYTCGEFKSIDLAREHYISNPGSLDKPFELPSDFKHEPGKKSQLLKIIRRANEYIRKHLHIIGLENTFIRYFPLICIFFKDRISSVFMVQGSLEMTLHCFKQVFRECEFITKYAIEYDKNYTRCSKLASEDGDRLRYICNANKATLDRLYVLFQYKKYDINNLILFNGVFKGTQQSVRDFIDADQNIFFTAFNSPLMDIWQFPKIHLIPIGMDLNYFINLGLTRLIPTCKNFNGYNCILQLTDNVKVEDYISLLNNKFAMTNLIKYYVNIQYDILKFQQPLKAGIFSESARIKNIETLLSGFNEISIKTQTEIFINTLKQRITTLVNIDKVFTEEELKVASEKSAIDKYIIENYSKTHEIHHVTLVSSIPILLQMNSNVEKNQNSNLLVRKAIQSVMILSFGQFNPEHKVINSITEVSEKELISPELSENQETVDNDMLQVDTDLYQPMSVILSPSNSFVNGNESVSEFNDFDLSTVEEATVDETQQEAKVHNKETISLNKELHVNNIDDESDDVTVNTANHRSTAMNVNVVEMDEEHDLISNKAVEYVADKDKMVSVSSPLKQSDYNDFNKAHSTDVTYLEQQSKQKVDDNPNVPNDAEDNDDKDQRNINEQNDDINMDNEINGNEPGNNTNASNGSDEPDDEPGNNTNASNGSDEPDDDPSNNNNESNNNSDDESTISFDYIGDLYKNWKIPKKYRDEVKYQSFALILRYHEFMSFTDFMDKINNKFTKEICDDKRMKKKLRNVWEKFLETRKQENRSKRVNKKRKLSEI